MGSMADTQWPRYQVFVQEKDSAPFQDAGSVHAPDAELALQNGRDVFVRRPECAGLWVAPVEAIYARTAEEIHAQGYGETTQPDGATEPVEATGEETYHVFIKVKPGGTHTWACSVEAASPPAALRRAVERLSPQVQPFVWWVIPARRVTANDPAEAESWFAPARNKPFRLSGDFRTVTAMRQVRKGE